MDRTTIYLTPQSREAVAARQRDGDARSAVIQRMIERYAEIVRRHEPELSDAEWSLIYDALNGTVHDPAAMVALAPAGIADAIELDHLDEKWGVDGADLLRRLEALPYAARVAVVDRAERFWARGGQTDE